MRCLPLLLCLTFVAACSSPTAPSVELPAMVTLAPGSVAVVQGTGLSIRFAGVAQDSRCPADALCIQQGDAVLDVVLITAGGEAAHQLYVNDRSRSDAVAGSYLVTLETVSPYPSSATSPIAPADYRATFRISQP